MNIDRCEIVERKDSVFGLGMLVTLRSPLAADSAWARLKQLLPRFEVPPGYFTFAGPKPRIYFGSIHDNAFQIHSAVYIGKPRPTHLHVRGTIDPHGDESLIRLRVYSIGMNAGKLIFASVAVVVPVLLLTMFKDGVNLLSAVAFFVMATPAIVVSIVAIVLVHAKVQRELTFLLDYLRSTFR
jgi:hypothetical protein